jgi:hypothetical protein
MGLFSGVLDVGVQEEQVGFLNDHT